MKKLKILTLIASGLFSLSPCLAFAEEAVVTTTAAADNCEKTIFVADDELDAEECTNKNLFAAGNTVEDDSKVGGIGFLAGNTLNISGHYEFGVHAGNVVTISGTYDKDLFVAGNLVTIDEDAVIGGDLYAAGSTVTVKTELHDAYIAAAAVKIEANISGDVKIGASTIEIADGVKIAGKFSYNEDATLTAQDGFAATVETYEESEYVNVTETNVFTTILTTICGMIVVLIVALAIAPNTLKKYNERAEKFQTVRELSTMLRGFGVLIGVPAAAILLMVTIIGTFVGAVAFLLYFVALLLAIPMAGYFVGSLILKTKKDENFWYGVLRGLIGVAIIILLSYVPYVGGFITFVAMLWGLGLLIEATPFCRKK